jgi:hypothetical protein
MGELATAEVALIRDLGVQAHSFALAIYGLTVGGGSLIGYKKVLGNWKRVSTWVVYPWNRVATTIEDVVYDVVDGLDRASMTRRYAGEAICRIVSQAQSDRSPKNQVVKYSLLPAECARLILVAKRASEEFESALVPYYSRNPQMLRRRFQFYRRVFGHASGYAQRFLE